REYRDRVVRTSGTVHLPTPRPDGSCADPDSRGGALLRAPSPRPDPGDPDALRLRPPRRGLLRSEATRPQPDQLPDGRTLPVRSDRRADRLPARAAQRPGEARSEPDAASLPPDGA